MLLGNRVSVGTVALTRQLGPRVEAFKRPRLQAGRERAKVQLNHRHNGIRFDGHTVVVVINESLPRPRLRLSLNSQRVLPDCLQAVVGHQSTHTLLKRPHA